MLRVDVGTRSGGMFAVPGAPPQNVSGLAEGPTSIRVSWRPPPAERSNGRIVYYKLHYVEAGRSDSEATEVKLNTTSFLIDELKRWTDYRIWVLAGTSVGDGPPSYPINVRTHEDVPGDPQDVKVQAINSTSIHVSWKPPAEKERNGIIRGYHIHVQETKEEGKSLLNEPMRFDVLDGAALELNISGLQPDTKYSVQVAALTRKGDGDRSQPVSVKTPGGVPNRPTVNLKILEREPEVSIELEWSRPTMTYGELQGYRLRYGVKETPLKEELTKETSYKINQLERGVEYEFRVAGQNAIGFGQETIKYLLTPEGPPTGPPANLSHHFQTPDVVCVTWDQPSRIHRNGQITHYDVQFHKKSDQSTIMDRNTTATKEWFEQDKPKQDLGGNKVKAAEQAKEGNANNGVVPQENEVEDLQTNRISHGEGLKAIESVLRYLEQEEADVKDILVLRRLRDDTRRRQLLEKIRNLFAGFRTEEKIRNLFVGFRTDDV